MLSFTESVTITASPGVIWTHLVDLERWWTASNPDHVRLEILSPDKSIAVGTRIDFEERIAGLRIVAGGQIISRQTNCEMTWEGTAACHSAGFTVQAQEGMKWRIAELSGLALVSASLWIEFAGSTKGRLMEWHARKHLRILDAGREHMRRELNRLKELAEMDEAAHRE